MSAQDNTRLVQEAYAAFGRGDIPAVLNYFSDDLEFHHPGPKELPLTGTRRGVKQFSEFFNDLDQGQEILTFEPREFIAEGDTVVAIVHYRARVKATGRIAETDLVHIFSVRDGKIVRMRQIYDTANAMYAYDVAFAAQNAAGS